MPPLPNEVCLLTVFVDVHYYFSAPTPRPLHHRFDKGSYLYIYHDAAQNKARMEIANHPGMPEQDAFCGSLGAVHLRNSDKFPTLCTLIVDAHRQSTSGPSMPSIVDQNEWLLLNIDPRDESRAFLRLHTLDLYFWTSGDATLFLQNARKLLAPAQLDIIPASQQPQAHEVAMSSVVQKLENVAITDPAYHNGQTRNSRTEAVPIQQPQPQLAIQNFPPPPTQSAISEPVSPLEAPSAQPVSKQEEAQINYTPIAYNPSAPAAPEPIKLREQTPPPPDGVTGTGLAAAAVSDSGQAFAPRQCLPGFPLPHPIRLRDMDSMHPPLQQPVWSTRPLSLLTLRDKTTTSLAACRLHRLLPPYRHHHQFQGFQVRYRIHHPHKTQIHTCSDSRVLDRHPHRLTAQHINITRGVMRITVLAKLLSLHKLQWADTRATPTASHSNSRLVGIYMMFTTRSIGQRKPKATRTT
ncbi:RNA recognition motif-containing protein [Histoplasma capsulatum]|uniref:RNA recognition motif-containing protein n=1 Tax=Ajellomyces capsulatus TaxID=5037 RepID=A0A8H8CZS8_AJECA|nr:RNA recognition motif-containing protein [Histoplasma capsulatum]